MAPTEIRLMMGFYDNDTVCSRSPELDAAHSSLESFGLIKYKPEKGYQITKRGRVYVEQGLCPVELPEMEWTYEKTHT